MNLPHKGLEIKKEAKWSIQSKSTTLNPNAAEFVPSSLKPANESNDTYRLDLPGTSRKVVLDRSDTTLHNSDDEAHQYWRRQLPDDITPDFAATGKDDLPGPELLRLAGLSIFDENVGSRVPESANRQTLHAQLTSGLTDELGYSDSMFHEDQSSVSFTTPANDSWDNQYIKAAQHMSNGLDDVYHLNGSSSAGFVNNSFIDHLIMEDSAINHVEFLALQFPGFSAESLAEVYYANSCDLNLTIEILTQLELQMDAGFTQNQNLKAMATPNLNALDFPALPVTDSRNTFATYSRGNIQQADDLYRSPSSLFRGPPDFASAVRKLASQDNGAWKHERNSSVDSFGSSGVNRQLLANSYKGNGKLAHENKLQGVGAARAGSVWLETGDAVANVYSTSREEARDFARLRNTCFQQAREAYLIGNKALAKELGDKGKWYNLQMKEAHAKARETIYRQRNPLEFQGYGRGGQERMIDLHGLHVNEAIHVLKHELATLRNAARSGGHRLQVLICVGTGHHTKGARTPARLPIAVEQYLVEEGLHYTQSQPGLLRVVIY